MMKIQLWLISISLCMSISFLSAEEGSWFPEILKKDSKAYIPDYSFAGYQWGEKELPKLKPTMKLTDFGAVPNDGKDDTEAFQKALQSAMKTKGTVVLSLPPGKLILNDILYIERSDFVLQGAGNGKGGTTIYIPRSLEKMNLPASFHKKKEYLIKNKKYVKGKLFSLFSWSAGVIWTRIPKGHPRSLEKAKIVSGKRGGNEIVLDNFSKFKKGDVALIHWHNTEGKNGSLLKHVLGDDKLKIGPRLYENPTKPLFSQPITIAKVNKNKITIVEKLLHDLRPEWGNILKGTNYLERVGIENIRIEFPQTKYAGHHLEEGYNGLYLTGLMHSWVRNVTIHNTDAAILSGACKNTTYDGIEVTGRPGHYSVHMGGCYGMVCKNFKFESGAIHDPSFNSHAKLCVYTNGKIRIAHLDQHCALNHQNLFDKIRVEDGSQLFKHGGAKYWYPTAGLFNTFWNIQIEKGDKLSCSNAPGAIIVGLTGGKNDLNIKYGPSPTVEGTNKHNISVPSLYEYQLKQRLKLLK